MKRILTIILAVAVVILGILNLAMTYYTRDYSLDLIGEKDMTVGLNAVYEEPGAKAFLNGKDISADVRPDGTVDTSKPGTYELKYKVGNLEVVRTVTVDTEMNPKIELKEYSGDDMKLGDEFEEPGYRAVDEDGNDITDDVKVVGADITKAGTNTLTYTVSDSKGHTTRVTRKVEVTPNTEYDTPGLPICMFHYVYDENDPPEDLNRRFDNYISAQDLEEELEWLNEEGYYYPTWKEVRAYIDGKQLLPEKSIVLCFDDGAVSFLKNGIPVLEKCEVPATCFMITSNDGEEKVAKYKSDYVTYESHSDNMHRAGGHIGHGGIFTAISEEEGLADLRKSIDICGSGDAFAYPYGDYTVSCRDIVEEAGFLCGVTTEYGKARPGTDPMLLPRVRMVMGQSLESFKDKVSPR